MMLISYPKKCYDTNITSSQVMMLILYQLKFYDTKHLVKCVVHTPYNASPPFSLKQ